MAMARVERVEAVFHNLVAPVSAMDKAIGAS
jgi:hypothetical protein